MGALTRALLGAATKDGTLAAALQATLRRGVAQQCDGHPQVYVRGTPQGSTIGNVPNGTAVTICDETDDHYKVEIPSANLTGWVKRSNIKLDGEVVAAEA